MITQKRGKNMAVAGLVLQVIFAAVMLAVWLATGSLAAMSCTWLLAAGLAVWLMVLVLFYCRQLERREAEELEDIAAHAGGGGTIFTGDQEADHRPAARRLAWMERWVVPIFTILWACMHAAAGAVAMRYLLNTQAAELTQAAPAVLFLLLIGFLAFLFSRYAIGMSSERQWRLLRAAGSYLLVNVLAIAGVVAALLSASQGYGYVDAIAAYVIPIVQLVLAAELLLNFVLDLYRPRLPGQEHRPSFDSRLLNLIAEPSKVGHSVAETLNYQFGFEVSKTWFYQLIGRAFGPLLIFGVVVLFAMSSLVVVREGEQYIVLHWGRADPAERTLRPGLHLKWPWPIDTAMRFQTGKVHEILLGAGPARSAEERRAAFVKGRELYLWTEEHGRRKELNFLVANPVPAREAREADKRPPVSIIRLVVPVQYRVHNVYDYYRRMQDAESMLEQIASREMVRYCASATLNAPAGEKAADRPEAIMTYGRRRAAAELKRRIQEEADNLSLGVEITYVGMLAVHPPPEAAPAFQDVLKAERKQDQMRYQAEAEAADMLAEVVGDPTEALKLALSIRTLQELEDLSNRRDDPAERADMLREYITVAMGDLVAIEREIQRERLLGQLRPGKTTPRQKLRDEHQKRLAILSRIQADPAVFDYAGAIETARKEADDRFQQAVGSPAALVAQAQAYRWRQELTERARLESFRLQMLAYQAGPRIYMLDRWLDVWDEALPNMEKYVLGIDRRRVELWLNWERQSEAMERVTFESEDAGR